MNRSRIFLGLTATLLAVVAFAATKAKSTITKTCYVTAGSAATVISYGSMTGVTTTNHGGAPVKVFGRQLYTYLNAQHRCVTPLYSE